MSVCSVAHDREKEKVIYISLWGYGRSHDLAQMPHSRLHNPITTLRAKFGLIIINTYTLAVVNSRCRGLDLTIISYKKSVAARRGTG